MQLPRRRKVEYPFHYSPDWRLVHFVAEVQDKPGALAFLLNTLGTKLNLIGTTSYSAGDGTAIFSGFGQVLSKHDTAQSIQALAAETHSAIACRAWESKEGFLVDTFHTGLQNGLGEPFIMVPTASLAKSFEEVVRVFGSGGKTILYLQGMDYAKARWRLFSLLLGPHAEKRTEEIFSIFEAFGLGTLTVSSESNGKTLRLVVRDCFECSVSTSTGRSCEFIRGMVVGYFGGVFGKEVGCEETKCRLKGDKLCEFVLKTSE